MIDTALLLSPHNDPRDRGSRGTRDLYAKSGYSARWAFSSSYSFHSLAWLSRHPVVGCGVCANPSLQWTATPLTELVY